MLKNILASTAILAATSGGIVATDIMTAHDADALRPIPAHARPCANEGMNNCVWDAVHMGNGMGHSYYASPEGRVFYIKHARAHRMVR